MGCGLLANRSSFGLDGNLSFMISYKETEERLLSALLDSSEKNTRETMTKTTLTVMSLFLGWTSWAVPDFTVELTTSGYAGQEELKNFPVLVRISPEKIPGFYYYDCGERGADI